MSSHNAHEGRASLDDHIKSRENSVAAGHVARFLLRVDNDKTHEHNKNKKQLTMTSLAGGLSSPRPRFNFPLPRELRDQIYGYLLDDKYTRITRTYVSGRAYEFHTNIMAVNRQIHDEAEEYLYKNNDFIVIHHQSHRQVMRPRHTLMQPWVPPVAELGAKKVKHCSLEVTLQRNLDPAYTFRPQWSSWLLLAKGLVMYCSAVPQYLTRYMSGSRPHVPVLELKHEGLLLDQSFGIYGQALHPDRLRLTFQSHHFREMTAEFHSLALSHFRPVISHGLCVEICNSVSKNTEARSSEIYKQPSLACATAADWYIISNLDSLKRWLMIWH